MISIPQLSGSFSSINDKSARPPPNSSANISRKFVRTWTNVSVNNFFVVELIRAMTSSNSRRELLDVISRINSTTKKLFADTFAQVRANFKEMFAELFGGGRADLSLLDENDPLNCGIEITAKPPGKQLQSISLLSGGERAMVAVALLFAIYMVRPSPFCVLDEIDAPLDESNINRFIHILERFVEQSQFIIITHNKRTIAKADVLYGVTMEERGVSKLVGMKLAAPRQVAAESGSNGNGHSEATAQRHFALATR